MAVNVSSAPPLALLTDVPSHNGAYRASMTPSSGAIRGNYSLTWTLDIRTAAGAPVESASLALEGWMPDNETAGVIRPRTPAGLGDGRYRVEGLRFDSRGWWNVRLRISAAGVTDSLAFNLVLDQ
jgi:hypothetical protein